MKTRLIAIVAVCAAVIAAAVAAVKVSTNRAEEAKAIAEAEAATADAESAKARTANAAKTAETEKRRTAEAEAKAKADELEAQKLAKETAELESKTAADRKETAQAEAEAEQAKADAARAARDEERAKADAVNGEKEKARSLARAEAAKADAEANRLASEKLKSERVIAEAKLLEQRQADYEKLMRETYQLKMELDEQLAALKPEKTIADLAWAGGMEDSIIDEKGNIKKQIKVVYDPEKDMSLPETSRKLAKADRLAKQALTNSFSKVRESVIMSMETLYVQALRDGRVIDAAYYRNNIKLMYPDWEFKGEKKPENGKSEQEEREEGK